MALKKSKGKKANPPKKGAAKPDIERLNRLCERERVAELIQTNENELRANEEQKERNSLIKEEQLRVLWERDNKIDELKKTVAQLNTILSNTQAHCESQLRDLYLTRDTLLNEVSSLKAESADRQQLLDRERENCAVLLSKQETDHVLLKAVHQKESSELREKLCNASIAQEKEKKKAHDAIEARARIERETETKTSFLERELKNALIMNKALQEAVEIHEADDKKNITLMQLLNAQIDESKRHYEELLENERVSAAHARDELLQSSTKCQVLYSEKLALREEFSRMQQLANDKLHEYKQQLEQVQYDAQYIGKELDLLRKENTELARSKATAQVEAEEERHRHAAELEAVVGKCNDLKELLAQKEKDFFDKITFMNAQVCNNRTTINQLQENLRSERNLHELELERRTLDVRQAIDELNEMKEAESTEFQNWKQQEKALLAENSTLKSSKWRLQAAVNEKIQENEDLKLSTDAEMKRLSDLLDVHFIPHRKDAGERMTSPKEDKIIMLNNSVCDLKHELALRQQSFNETETWLKARVANQCDVIEALQADLRASESKRVEEAMCFEGEIARLKKTLDLHLIPCEM